MKEVIILLLVILLLVLLLALNRDVLIPDITRKYELRNGRNQADVLINREKNLIIQVNALLFIDIVGTHSYHAWIKNITGNVLPLGRMTRYRDGDYRIHYESKDLHRGYNSVFITEEDNPNVKVPTMSKVILS